MPHISANRQMPKTQGDDMNNTEVRNQIVKQYSIDVNGVIRDCGKFEGEMLYVPYFWNQGLDGAYDEDFANVYLFKVSDEDRSLFPDIGTTYGIALEESGQGFVNSKEYATKEEYDAEVARLENEDSSEYEG